MINKATVERFLESQGASDTEIQAVTARFDAVPENERARVFDEVRARFGKVAASDKSVGARAPVQTKAPPPKPVVRTRKP
jgi:hypothetical protein